MNLFWKNLMGGIPSAAKIEKNEADTLRALKRYDEVVQSVELEEYKKLFHLVRSSDFQENKKILQNRKYKDTEEYRVTKKFHKLQNSAAIQLYFKVLESQELNQFETFKASADYEQLGDRKKVKASTLLTQMKAYEKSKAYKTYARFHNSFIIKDFKVLKEKINTPEFKKSNEFWANPHRWHTTPEFEHQERFYTLSKNPDIVFYENEKPNRFEKIRNIKLTFDDEFDWNTLDNSHWNFGFHYKSTELIGDHSFVNERQANHSGKNVSVENGILKIETKHEKVTARAWHPKKGFIEKEFQYTSDVIQTADKFRQQYGVFKAKVRCNGKLHHACWLGADAKLPQINIFHYDGKQIRIGNSFQHVVDGIKIKGLNPHIFHIFTLVWTEKELVWLINDLEVYRTKSHIPKEPMYLAFNSFIPEKQHGTIGNFEVDWVRVYTNIK